MKKFNPNDSNVTFVAYQPISELNGQEISVVLHPLQYKLARGEDGFEAPSQSDVFEHNRYGSNGSVSIFVSTLVPQGKMCIIKS